jgi:hypothetical protein
MLDTAFYPAGTLEMQSHSSIGESTPYLCKMTIYGPEPDAGCR